jgi:hypothetical protein
MKNKEKPLKTLKFTISCGGGDGAFLCFQKVSKETYDYFHNNNLDLEEYALDYDYADRNKIPEEMQPFNAGERAAFGYYESGMTVTDDLDLYIEDENSNEIFSGKIPKTNIKQDKIASEFLKNMEKGIYAVGYEGLEDCYISGNLETNSTFDIKKFKIKFTFLDYQLGDRELISSIAYDNEEIEWQLDSYEGTGDNAFGFVIVK